MAWYYAAMAKQTDIGRGFAAVMNHPEPGPIVFRMAARNAVPSILQFYDDE
jgi:hypothetical protein